MPGGPSSFSYGVTPEVPPVCPYVPAPPDALPFTGHVSSVGDGGANALERVTTLGQSLPVVMMVSIAGDIQYWQLDAASDSNDAFHQRPNDYADPANVRVWVRVG